MGIGGLAYQTIRKQRGISPEMLILVSAFTLTTTKLAEDLVVDPRMYRTMSLMNAHLTRANVQPAARWPDIR